MATSLEFEVGPFITLDASLYELGAISENIDTQAPSAPQDDCTGCCDHLDSRGRASDRYQTKTRNADSRHQCLEE